MKRCESCGAPMTRELGDLVRSTCTVCPRCVEKDGSLLPMEEIIGRLAAHLVESLDIAPEPARRIARIRIASLPAWQRRAPDV